MVGCEWVGWECGQGRGGLGWELGGGRRKERCRERRNDRGRERKERDRERTLHLGKLLYVICSNLVTFESYRQQIPSSLTPSLLHNTGTSQYQRHSLYILTHRKGIWGNFKILFHNTLSYLTYNLL